MSLPQVNCRSHKRWIALAIMLLSAICCLGSSYELVPRFKLYVNQILWSATKPSEYYMEVSELSLARGQWRWAVRVRNGQVISSQLLDVNLFNPAAAESSTLDKDSLSVEQIFAIADRFCVDRGFWDCGLYFDSRFHYPTLMDSYEMMVIRVARFTPCEQMKGNCP